MAVVKHYRDLLKAGRPTPKQPEKEACRGMTLPELEALLREDKAKRLAQTHESAA